VTVYQRGYDWLRRHQSLRQFAQRLVALPAVEANPLYRQLYRHRIQQVVAKGASFPPRVQIEVTNLCNAHCLMCPRDSLERPKGIMSLSLSRQILDECAAMGTREVILSGYGEPLLDKHLEERIVYAKERGLPRVAIFTNGSLLDEKRASRILDTPLDAITISFDGATREVYEHIRQGLHYDRVVENIERLRTLRDQRGRTTPLIYVNMVQQRDNVAEARMFMSRWQGIADYAFIEPLHNMGGEEEIGALGLGGSWRRRYPCYHLWTGMEVYWNGAVGLCCVDYNGSAIMGDVTKSPLCEIWNGEAFRAVRELHQAGQYSMHPLCRDCTADHSWWHTI